MSEFVVHGIIGSPFVRAVLLALEEKGLPYRLEPLRPGAHRSAEYLARHPFGRVPMVEHGDSSSTKPRRCCAISSACSPSPP